MDYEWIAIGLGDVAWLAVAFVLGFLSRQAGLPPLVGYLVAGFLLSTQGVTNDVLLQKFSDLGITMLLFTVGLKLNVQTLMRPQVWAVAGLHMLVVVVAIGMGIYALALAGAALFDELGLRQAMLVAFALSFSSTVFVVKALEERGALTSLHGRVAVGILLMQDVAAVVFLAISTGTLPSAWALLLLLLIPARPVLHIVLQRIGHGELFILYGFLLALGGAEVFELVGMKGDLGALILGVLIASHAKAEDLSKAMLGFKDLFLLGFFLSIGLAGQPTPTTLFIAIMLTPVVFLKSALFYLVLTRFRLRARTSLLASLNLNNYSEFGLIVAAIGVANGWISGDWLVVIAIALSISFVLAAALNTASHWIYTRYHSTWLRFQREDLVSDDRMLDLRRANIAVIGMGRVGIGAYDSMRERYGDTVVGIDIDPVTTARLSEQGRQVLRGDPSDADFWDRVQASHSLELVMLTVPKLQTTLAVLERLREVSFQGEIAAVARYPDEVDVLQRAGAKTVFNFYMEAGAGFADHVSHTFVPARSA